ncbi:MAG: hypothetical protein U0350_41500 [Caldilineaceae bacterium]
MTEQTTQEAIAEIWRLFKATDARLDQRFKETDERLDQRFRETDEKLRRLEGLFGAQWGKLMEALVQPNLVQLFRGQGIDVHYVSERVKSQLNGQTREIDLLLENTDTVVAVEVKTTLCVSDIDDFLADLAEFPVYYAKFQRNKLYSAVAGLDIVEQADRYAYRRGLYVLNVSGTGMVQILNDPKFKPRNFAV